MQPVVSKIVNMLDDERADRRYAAVMVLGQLGLKEAGIVNALTACLKQDDPLLQTYVLDALAALRPRRVAQHVTPLLESGDEQVRLRAIALLAREGERAAASRHGPLVELPR